MYDSEVKNSTQHNWNGSRNYTSVFDDSNETFSLLNRPLIRIFILFPIIIFLLEKDDSRRHSTKSPGIKCVVVGDGTAGKTNLILSYLQDGYTPNSSYSPTAFDKYNGK